MHRTTSSRLRTVGRANQVWRIALLLAAVFAVPSALGGQVPPTLIAEAEWEPLASASGVEVSFNAAQTNRADGLVGTQLRLARNEVAPGASVNASVKAVVLVVEINCDLRVYRVFAEEYLDADGETLNVSINEVDDRWSIPDPAHLDYLWVERVCELDLTSD